MRTTTSLDILDTIVFFAISVVLAAAAVWVGMRLNTDEVPNQVKQAEESTQIEVVTDWTRQGRAQYREIAVNNVQCIEVRDRRDGYSISCNWGG